MAPRGSFVKHTTTYSNLDLPDSTLCVHAPRTPRGPCKVFIWEGRVVIRSEHKGSLGGGGATC